MTFALDAPTNPSARPTRSKPATKTTVVVVNYNRRDDVVRCLRSLHCASASPGRGLGGVPIGVGTFGNPVPLALTPCPPLPMLGEGEGTRFPSPNVGGGARGEGGKTPPPKPAHSDGGGHHDTEIILVDNCSTDGSADVVEEAFPDVRVLRNPTNGGFAQANNLAARAAHGQYLVFLNPDTVVEPGWLDALIAPLEADPSVGLTTSKILLLADPRRVNACGNAIHHTGLTLCRGLGLDRDAFLDLEEVSAISGAAFAIRRELYDALGGFDDDFFLYMEDTDLSIRARLAGYRCVCVPSSVVYHDYRLRVGPHKTFYQERNRYLMLLKCLRWKTLLVLAPSLLLAEMVTWGFVLARDRRHWRNKLRAYWWVPQHWKRVMARRRRAQSLRAVGDRALLAHSTHRLDFEQSGGGSLVAVAHAVFDPLFGIFHRLALGVVRW